MTLPTSKDFSHFFSEETKSRKPSPLKTCFRYFTDPNVIFLGGGLPLSDYFPWKSIEAESPLPPFTKGIGALPSGSEEDTLAFSVQKNGKVGDDIPLARGLQYGHTAGQPELLEFLRGHTKEIHDIKYSDWDVLASIGNTGAWDSTLRVFCNRGDVILAEEYSFSSSLAASEAQGVITVPVPIDAYGIVPEKLDKLLDEWTPGAPKPKLLYTIPTGQNPTGTSLPADRRESIYRIAQKHDFLIVEDEPYYFLQVGDYVEDSKKREEVYSAPRPSHEDFKKSLVKTFLSCDTEGRVIRLDSFSKILGPGTRLGWITAQKNILTAYLRFHEMSIQSPAGFTQVVVSGTLNRWGQGGYLDWLIGLRQEYLKKRDHTLDVLAKHLPKNDIFTVVPPVAGMFFTVHVDASAHPEFKTKYESDPAKVEQAIFSKVISNGVLVVPGCWFKTTGQTNPPLVSSKNDADANDVFFRGTYAAVAPEKLEEGLKRLCKTLQEEFGLAN